MTGPEVDPKTPYESVQPKDRDDSPSPVLAPKQRTLTEKLGTYNIVVLLLGTVAILLAVAFLAFVWTVANNNTDGGHLPPLWRMIVERQWVSRVVTLCSIVIRVAAAAQLCVFAAIVAALILERVGASTEDLPLLSMIRCANTGPNALLWNVVHTMGTGTQVGYSTLIVLTILNALAMQFTSTMLLADLVPTRIVLQSVTRETYFSMSSLDNAGAGSGVNPYAGSDVWRTGSQSYPRFAEYRASAATQGSNFTDTGKLYRGFLPLVNANERNVLRNYSGPMTVVDVRTVCLRPVLSNLTFNYLGEGHASIFGSMELPEDYPAVATTGSEVSVAGVMNTFNCTAPSQDITNFAATWNASLCVLGAGHGRLLDGISSEELNDGSLSGVTTAQVLLNATEMPLYEDYFMTENQTTLEQKESSQASWARFGDAQATFDMSLCFIKPLPRDYEVSVWSAVDASSDIATSVTAGKTAGMLIYDTSKIQRMLGADGTNLSPEDRQLLTLVPPPNWNASRMVSLYDTPESASLVDSLSKIDYDDYMGDTFQLVPWSLPQDAMHRSHVALLQNILSRSNDPALALQSLWTILLELAYYDVLPLYNIKVPAKYGLAREVLIPVRWNCFAAVMGILVLHLVLVCTALVLFITRTEMSLLGNAWQAVSQVLSTDTADAVHHGAMATDEEVKDTFKGSGIAEGRILITKSESSGRTEATAVVRRR
ncbi:hypothetical protein ACN47E_008571 [Coniothyrium glycines]